MASAFQEFEKYINEKVGSVNTRLAYLRDISHMFEWLKTQEVYDAADVNGALLMQYIELMEKDGRTSATISRNIASMKKFFGFTKSKGYTFADPAANIKSPKVIRKSPEILSEKDIKKLLAAPDVSTAKGVRDKAILELMASTGINTSEIIALKVGDVNFRTQTVKVEADGRVIEFGRKTMDHLKAYSKVRKQFLEAGRAGDRTYFLSCAGEKLTRQGFWKIVRTCGKMAGIDEISPKTLRHSFAVAALRHGKDAAFIQQMLGHSSKAGVQEYKSLAEK
ncbi:MAG: tyrosine-type recombinase/integrase [Eubacteriales bacterium]|nr:tyrosine-type recombinase/integrase [Eubacteriales bacterium]